MSTGPADATFDKVKARQGGRSGRVRAAVMQAVRTELAQKGYNGISHRAVASVAGVDHVTVYRRWPTRARLVADMALEIADTAVPVPDTGRIEGDLRAYLENIVHLLTDPGIRPLMQAFVAASIEGDEEVGAVLSEIWNARFTGAYPMLDRAVERGEIPSTMERELLVEALVAPAWFRVFVRQAPLDADFLSRSVRKTMDLAWSSTTTTLPSPTSSDKANPPD